MRNLWTARCVEEIDMEENLWGCLLIRMDHHGGKGDEFLSARKAAKWGRK